MKLNLLLTVLVVLASVVVAALTLRAVLATQAVISRGEAAQSAGDRSGAEPCVCLDVKGPNGLRATECVTPAGIDRCNQDLNLRAPFGVEYASMIYYQKLYVPHAGDCGGLPMPGMTS